MKKYNLVVYYLAIICLNSRLMHLNLDITFLFKVENILDLDLVSTQGHCISTREDRYDFLFTDSVKTKDDCINYCVNIPNAGHLLGFEVMIEPQNEGCSCLYENGRGPDITQEFETERD